MTRTEQSHPDGKTSEEQAAVATNQRKEGIYGISGEIHKIQDIVRKKEVYIRTQPHSLDSFPFLLHLSTS